MENLNKTIVITYDDATRMVDFCKNNEKVVSKEFYDWYLGDGEYFSKSGMLIIDEMIGEKEKCAVSFDFTNPDAVEFNVYRYKDQSIICNFFFYRQQNMTMDNVSVDIKYFSAHFFKGQKTLWLSPEIKERVVKIAQQIAKNEVQRRKTGQRASKTDLIIEGSVNAAFKEINTFNCKTLVYFTYAMMYYVSKQETEEITSAFKTEINTEGEKIKSIYKYTGYVDLRENKTYKPIVKKDPDEPMREYQRHIQSWTVRGHYRNTKNGRIWIDPHIKGEGELEKRIYGTEDEKDLNLIPKIFEVTRTIYDEKQKEAPIKKIETQKKIENIIIEKNEKPIKFLQKFTSAWKSFISFFYLK